jgi:hypothetical protein
MVAPEDCEASAERSRPPTRAVLIVEDNAELRSLTAALLEDEQVDTIECVLPPSSERGVGATAASSAAGRCRRQLRPSLSPRFPAWPADWLKFKNPMPRR